MVPEPSSMTLVLIAAPVVLLAWRRRAGSHITRSSAQGWRRPRLNSLHSASAGRWMVWGS